jgi:hypothetical protein
LRIPKGEAIQGVTDFWIASRYADRNDEIRLLTHTHFFVRDDGTRSGILSGMRDNSLKSTFGTAPTVVLSVEQGVYLPKIRFFILLCCFLASENPYNDSALRVINGVLDKAPLVDTINVLFRFFFLSTPYRMAWFSGEMDAILSLPLF